MRINYQWVYMWLMVGSIAQEGRRCPCDDSKRYRTRFERGDQTDQGEASGCTSSTLDRGTILIGFNGQLQAKNEATYVEIAKNQTVASRIEQQIVEIIADFQEVRLRP